MVRYFKLFQQQQQHVQYDFSKNGRHIRSISNYYAVDPDFEWQISDALTGKKNR
jgi:hypothetical protein